MDLWGVLHRTFLFSIFLQTSTSIFGSPDVFRLRKEPINSLSSVRGYVCQFRSYSLDRLIFFLIFCMKLGLHTTLNDIKKNFGRKNFLTPKMAKNGQNLAIFGQNSRFWVFLAYNFQTPLWIFLIFGMEVVPMVFFFVFLILYFKFFSFKFFALFRGTNHTSSCFRFGLLVKIIISNM